LSKSRGRAAEHRRRGVGLVVDRLEVVTPSRRLGQPAIEIHGRLTEVLVLVLELVDARFELADSRREIDRLVFASTSDEHE